MAWVKLDDQARHHRKLLAAGPVGAWLWTCGLMYCNSQKAKDGFIPEAAVPVLYPIPGWRREAARLVSVGLWTRVDGGYDVHDYHEYQPSADAEAIASKRSAAGKIGGQRSGEVRRSKQTTKQFASLLPKQLLDEATNPVPSRPDPVHKRSEIPLPPVGVQESIVKPERPARPERVVEMGTARCQAACETFVSALAELGWTRGQVRSPWEREALCDAINANLRADGSAEGMLAELRRAVVEWSAAYADRARFTSGWGARKFADWLAEGRESPAGAPAPRPPTQPTTTDAQVVYAPPTPEEAAELEQALRDMVDPAKRPGANVGPARPIGEDLPPDDLARLEAKRRETVARLRAELAAGEAAVAS